MREIVYVVVTYDMYLGAINHSVWDDKEQAVIDLKNITDAQKCKGAVQEFYLYRKER